MISYVPLKITLFTRDMNLAQLSRELGISPVLMYRYMSGSVHPSLDILDRITDILNCDIDEVIRYDHEDSIENKVSRYEDELRMCFVSPPSNLEEFIGKMVEAYRKGLEEK